MMDDCFPDSIHAVTPLDFNSSFSHTEFVAWNVIFYHLMYEADNHHSIQNTCLTLNRPEGRESDHRLVLPSAVLKR